MVVVWVPFLVAGDDEPPLGEGGVILIVVVPSAPWLMVFVLPSGRVREMVSVVPVREPVPAPAELP